MSQPQPFSFTQSKAKCFIQSNCKARLAWIRPVGPGFRVAEVYTTVANPFSDDYTDLPDGITEESVSFATPESGYQASKMARSFLDGSEIAAGANSNWTVSVTDATHWLFSGAYSLTNVSAAKRRKGNRAFPFSKWSHALQRLKIIGPASGCFVFYRRVFNINSPDFQSAIYPATTNLVSPPYTFPASAGWVIETVEPVEIESYKSEIRASSDPEDNIETAVAFWIGKTLADFP